jgi:phage baseplate assembly protein W
MAIILGSKLVQDVKKYEDYAIGITLPLQFAENTFAQSFKTSEQAKSNIKNVLLTKKGERPMQPEFGSGLQEILFDFNDDELAGKIESTINEAIQQWLPYVNIEDILVENGNYERDNNLVNISITFSVLNDPELNSVTFNVAV